jgi:BirA family biotin operon repressor/biotin-[acetyl-CoA-carboxylase] ligase
VLASGRKLAGVLTEMAAEVERVQWVVLGLGVNVNATAEDFPEELRAAATSLRLERGEPVPRALFAAAVLTALEEWLDRHAADGFGPVRAAWREMSDTLGREVRVRCGAADLTGVAEDVDEAGALLVRTAGGLERVLAGDVELLRPAAPSVR